MMKHLFYELLLASMSLTAVAQTCLINHILAHSKETSAQFDLNGDGKVDVSDVTMLIELALKPTS